MDTSLQGRLQARFGIPGVLTFEEHNGLTRLQVSTPEAAATLYLQGAHLTHWQPAGQQAVLFLSRKSEFAPGKPIRGGIPIAFPWFATDAKQDRVDGHPGPSHGFARLQDWTLQSAARKGDAVALRLTLAPTALSKSMGFDSFLLTLEVVIGRSLAMQLTVANPGKTDLHFEEAFHTYFSVLDVHEVKITGLEPTPYIDKNDGFKVKPASGAPIVFTGPTDRVYQDTGAMCTIHAGTQGRDLHIDKANSETTVVWNPWKEMPDVGEWDWHGFVCVETVNGGKNARVLAPGEKFTMRAVYTVERWKLEPGL